MKVVKRSWILNRSTGAQVLREGFQIVPDYAGTAHMVQGMNLDAAIADCDDVHSHPSLQDMMSGIVIISRVKYAHFLKLMRMFSPKLFGFGPPPGPHVLMKFLRREITQEQADEKLKSLEKK